MEKKVAACGNEKLEEDNANYQEFRAVFREEGMVITVVVGHYALSFSNFHYCMLLPFFFVF